METIAYIALATVLGWFAGAFTAVALIYWELSRKVAKIPVTRTAASDLYPPRNNN